MIRLAFHRTPVPTLLFVLGAMLAQQPSPALANVPAGLKADEIVVNKAERRLYLYRDGKVIASYRVALGLNPRGPKVFLGDGRTPEGQYVITERNAASRFYRSLRISYPNEDDIARAGPYGISMGGDIMIHGQPIRRRRDHDPRSDWTEGCIAVTNPEMDEIWSAVDLGTPIRIQP